MAAQVTTVVLVIMGHGPFPLLEPVGYIALWVVLVTAMWSAVDYYRRFLILTSHQVDDFDSTINVRERKQRN